MAIEQSQLLKLSSIYSDNINQEFSYTHLKVKIPKPRVFISHSIWDFRMVQGFIVMLSLGGIDAFFDWDAGNETDAVREDPEDLLKLRIATAKSCIFLATKSSETSPYCLKAMHYASLIRRKTYISQTMAGDVVYGDSFLLQHPRLDIHKQKNVNNKYVVRVLENNRTYLWDTIPNIASL